MAQWLSMLLCKGIAGVFLQPHTVSALKHHRRQDEMISAVFNSFKCTPVFLHSWLCSHILSYCMTKDCRGLYVSKESAHFSIGVPVIHIWSHHLLQTQQYLTILSYYNDLFFRCCFEKHKSCYLLSSTDWNTISLHQPVFFWRAELYFLCPEDKL